MYKIISLDKTFEFETHRMAKLAEAVERGLQNDYEFHYPDGSYYECKINSALNPNS